MKRIASFLQKMAEDNVHCRIGTPTGAYGVTLTCVKHFAELSTGGYIGNYTFSYNDNASGFLPSQIAINDIFDAQNFDALEGIHVNIIRIIEGHLWYFVHELEHQ